MGLPEQSQSLTRGTGGTGRPRHHGVNVALIVNLFGNAFYPAPFFEAEEVKPSSGNADGFQTHNTLSLTSALQSPPGTCELSAFHSGFQRALCCRGGIGRSRSDRVNGPLCQSLFKIPGSANLVLMGTNSIPVAKVCK